MLKVISTNVYHPLMKIHNFRVPRNIIFGLNAAERVGTEAKHLGGAKALIVTDKIIEKIGLVENVKSSLEKEGLSVTVFDKIKGEPTIDMAEKAAETVREDDYDLVVGVGGGSSLDMAKVASTMATNPGNVRQYIGLNMVKKRGLPKILIPTTAGTGSEVSASAVMEDPDRKIKTFIRSPYQFADAAIVDPLMTVTMPPRVTAATGLDALSHAVEAFITVASSPIADPLALQAIKLVASNLPIAFATGENLESRYNMSLAALLAGMCLSYNAGVCGGHVAASAFSLEYNLPHGVSCALALPYIMEYNLMACTPKLAVVAEAMGESTSTLSLREAASKAVASVRRLVKDVNLPLTLKDLDIPKEAIPKLAENMMTRAGMLAKNPRNVTKEDAYKIFERMWAGE